MKNKLIYLLCLVLSIVMAFASCDEAEGGEGANSPSGGNQNQSHIHAYSENWSSDAKNHWHAATCEHGEIKDSFAEHTDADEDGKCDVCLSEIGHVHSYATEWLSDDSKHWQAASCSHSDQRQNEGLHKGKARSKKEPSADAWLFFCLY